MWFSRICFLATKVADSSIIEQDILRLTIRAGTGGQGIPRYNGIGGDGGDVYVYPRRGLGFKRLFETFKDQSKAKAEHGESSKQTKLIGKHGEHLYISVPLGSECVNAMTNQLLCRCTAPNQRILIAKGGKGGCAANQYKGQVGESLVVNIHMKLQPNVGLVGFPNAGKSTLLKALAPEKKSIKIAPYPFTTTKPQMLDVRFSKKTDVEQFTLSCADLPGIIEGAAQNKGRGHAFLKHLEYSDMLLMVVDVNGFQLSGNIEEKFRTGLESIALINKELEAFDKKIVKKPAILVLNKIDLSNGTEKADILEKILEENWTKELRSEMRPNIPIHFKAIVKASAKNREIGNLKQILQKIYEELHPIREISLDREFENPSASVMT